MTYDVLLTDIGTDQLSVTLAVMNSIQQILPLAVVDVNEARDWLTHLPVLLRRGISEQDARELQQRYEQLGSTIDIIPSTLFFPKNAQGITRWRNELFSEHLLALHERSLSDWAKDDHIAEAYRFSFIPTYGTDLTLRLWQADDVIHAIARRSIGHIGAMPGPPAQAIDWHPTHEQWQEVKEAMKIYRFWESKSWDTVPDGYTILASNHWVMEGIRGKHYKVLVDQTPNEGAAREVGLLMLNLLPDEFLMPYVE